MDEGAANHCGNPAFTLGAACERAPSTLHLRVVQVQSSVVLRLERCSGTNGAVAEVAAESYDERVSQYAL
eukprot:3872955-Amphidinium_carterae.1